MFTSFKRFTWKASMLTTLISLLVFTIALAASGDLDTTFSGDGLVTSFVVPSNPGRGDVARGIAIQTNGKIVAAGYSNVPTTNSYDFALTRYNTNGSLDTTFSGDGRLITNFGGDDIAFDVVVQPNGKIIATGLKCNAISGLCDVALARYNSGGALDTTFSGDGKQTTDYGEGQNGSNGGLAIQPDGKIVVAGYMRNSNDNSSDFAFYRYKANGSPDTAFHGSGKAHGGFGVGRQDIATDLVIQSSDGKIVVAGYTGDVNGNNNNFAIARLNADGTGDTTFSGDARQTTNFGADDYAYALALGPNGKIVVVGEKRTSTTSYFAVARYNTNGDLDITFNGTGKKAFSIVPGQRSSAYDVIVQSNGKIVVMGSTSNVTSSFDFAVVRLNSNGSFDTSFSGDGKVRVDWGGASLDFGYALALQPLDGKYVLGGTSDSGQFPGQDDFALARVLP